MTDMTDTERDYWDRFATLSASADTFGWDDDDGARLAQLIRRWEQEGSEDFGPWDWDTTGDVLDLLSTVRGKRVEAMLEVASLREALRQALSVVDQVGDSVEALERKARNAAIDRMGGEGDR